MTDETKWEDLPIKGIEPHGYVPDEMAGGCRICGHDLQDHMTPDPGNHFAYSTEKLGMTNENQAQ